MTEAGRGLVIRLDSGAIWLTSVSNAIVDSHTESGLCVQSLPDGITTVMFNIVQVNLNYKTNQQNEYGNLVVVLYFSHLRHIINLMVNTAKAFG